MKRAHAFRTRSAKEKLTSESSRVGVGIWEKAVLAFQFGVLQPVFTLTNVYLLIWFFTEVSAWDKEVAGCVGGSLPAAKVCLRGQAAHGEGASLS